MTMHAWYSHSCLVPHACLVLPRPMSGGHVDNALVEHRHIYLGPHGLLIDKRHAGELEKEQGNEDKADGAPDQHKITRAELIEVKALADFNKGGAAGVAASAVGSRLSTHLERNWARGR